MVKQNLICLAIGVLETPPPTPIVSANFPSWGMLGKLWEILRNHCNSANYSN